MALFQVPEQNQGDKNPMIEELKWFWEDRLVGKVLTNKRT